MKRRIDRFDKFMKYKGLNDNKVTQSLNLTIGIIGKSRKEGRDLSDKTIEKILNFYTDLNRIWLLTGEGEMLKESKDDARKPDMPAKAHADLIPLLPIAAQGGPFNDFVTSVRFTECEKIISPVNGVDFAITVSGDSMAPDFPNGSKILIKKINDSAFIEWGKVYVLDTCNGTVIKELRKGENEAEVMCHSLNPDPRYQPFRVRRSDIYGIYRVILLMSLK